jgi:hypothetical protein
LNSPWQSTQEVILDFLVDLPLWLQEESSFRIQSSARSFSPDNATGNGKQMLRRMPAALLGQTPADTRYRILFTLRYN